MRVRSDRLESLASPPFIATLALLVLNDVALKPLFHNALTGKLSDFAGLFALTLFAATLWPRYAHLASVLIAAAFTFWKSIYAEPLIESLNAISPFAVGRTVDLTDLIALPMIPLGVWAAPKVKPWQLPRAAHIGLAVLAPVAFTATSRLPYVVRSTMDVSSAAVVDEAALQSFFDDVAEQHGLRCRVCDPIGDGRAYLSRSGRGPSALTVNFDNDRQTVYFGTNGYERDGRRGVLAVASDIRDGISERFPGMTTLEFADTHEYESPIATAMFVIRVPASPGLAVESAERAKRTLSSIVEDVVRAHGLRADASSLVYYAGRRIGVGAEQRDFVLVPAFESNATLRVSVVQSSAGFEVLQRAVTDDLATRLATGFGAPNVTREGFGPD